MERLFSQAQRMWRNLLLLAAALGLSACSHLPEVLNLRSDLPRLEPVTGPVARLTQKFISAHAGERITLSAAPSLPLQANGSLQAEWTLTSAPADSQATLTPQALTAQLQVDRPGEYIVRLQVREGDTLSAPMHAYVLVDEANLPKTSFIAMGDFGTGGRKQYVVAKAIGQLCRVKDCDYVLGLGDNLYPKGAKTVRDPIFDTHFEQPYAGLWMPFLMVLGNHDNSGFGAGDGSFNLRGELEVAYAHRQDRASDKWRQPWRYYSFSAPFGGAREPLVDFFALDTTTMTSLHDPIKVYDLERVLQRQGDWLHHALRRGNGHWRIAFGHHTLLSNGQHGNAGRYELDEPLSDRYLVKRAQGGYFQEFFQRELCNQVDLFLSGHDHNLQWLKPPADCPHTGVIVSGAGAKASPLRDANRNPTYWQAGEQLGFFRIEATPEALQVEAYTVDDNDNGDYRLAYRGEIRK